MQDEHYEGVLLEEIRDQNKAILELVGDMKDHVKHIPTIQDDISELKSDVNAIKLALTDTNRQVQAHELRITSLEVKA